MRLLLLLSICLLTLNLKAQELLWEQTIGGTETDWLQHAFENQAGNYIFSGYSHSSASGDKTENSRGQSDFWIIETDKQGNLIWQKTIGGDSYDMIFKTLQLKDGSYLLVGHSYSGVSGDKTDFNRGDRDIWLVKLDLNKQIEWQKTYGGSGIDIPDDVVQTSDGGFLVLSNSNSPISGDKTTSPFGDPDLWVLKLDSTGNLQWQKSYGGAGTELGAGIIEKDNGNFFIGASSTSGISGNKTEPSRGNADYWIFEISPNGNMLWQKTIGGNNGDHLSDFVATKDGGYMLLGDSGSNVNGEKTVPPKTLADLWVVKVDASGKILWQKVYAGDGYGEWAISISASASSGYILSAMSGSAKGNDKSENGRGDRDFWMLKINEEGVVCWDKTLGGAGSDQPLDGFEDSDGNYVLGGYTDSGATGDKSEALIGVRDFWITKVKPPVISNPVVTVPEPFKECDRNGDGFAEFDLKGLDKKIIGEQKDLVIKYYDHNWNPLPSPLPAKFRNTVKNGQVINVVVSPASNQCARTELQIFLQVEGCKEGRGKLNLEFPKFFTPNNDGRWDKWRPKPEVAEQLSFIYIYDRYGKLLKQLTPDEGWDGISNGYEMPSDDYWFLAITKNNERQAGHFSLIRGSF